MEIKILESVKADGKRTLDPLPSMSFIDRPKEGELVEVGGKHYIIAHLMHTKEGLHLIVTYFPNLTLGQ